MEGDVKGEGARACSSTSSSAMLSSTRNTPLTTAPLFAFKHSYSSSNPAPAPHLCPCRDSTASSRRRQGASTLQLSENKKQGDAKKRPSLFNEKGVTKRKSAVLSLYVVKKSSTFPPTHDDKKEMGSEKQTLCLSALTLLPPSPPDEDEDEGIGREPALSKKDSHFEKSSERKARDATSTRYKKPAPRAPTLLFSRVELLASRLKQRSRRSTTGCSSFLSTANINSCSHVDKKRPPPSLHSDSITSSGPYRAMISADGPPGLRKSKPK
mmetsp:Transcript_35277/g.91661  ORF Transcript_35277/g.91661 Transcript_35277/m.91661 type:complete len:268 (-) Transcript_35277:3467-4270(-)